MKENASQRYLIPFIFVTSLFFLWGFAHSILNVLNKHFQDMLELTKAESSWIQAVVYGGYFLMALPAGMLIRRFGYKAVLITGMSLYAAGCFLFIPAGGVGSFMGFLGALFVIGCGLTCLETAANPYVTVLGDPEGGARRLTLSQSFNGLGWICGPLVGGLMLSDGGDVTMPYILLGSVVLVIALCFIPLNLPVISNDNVEAEQSGKESSLWSNKVYVFGLVALFFYVAAQTGISSFFINFADESISMDATTAAEVLGFGGMGLFLVGRLVGSELMKTIPAAKLLKWSGVLAVVTMALVIANLGMTSLVALVICFLAESLMFPIIFALAIGSVDRNKERASSYLIMCIVGGAIAPWIMGEIGANQMSLGFIVPLVCYGIVYLFASYLLKK